MSSLKTEIDAEAEGRNVSAEALLQKTKLRLAKKQLEELVMVPPKERHIPMNKKKNCALTFPEKLMSLLDYADQLKAHLDDPESICISWLPCGEGFLVRDPDVCADEIVPLFFKQAKFSSFTRKLYRWGFRQVQEQETVEPGVLVFACDHFKRDARHEISNMRSITAAAERRRLEEMEDDGEDDDAAIAAASTTDTSSENGTGSESNDDGELSSEPKKKKRKKKQKLTEGFGFSQERSNDGAKMSIESSHHNEKAETTKIDVPDSEGMTIIEKPVPNQIDDLSQCKSAKQFLMAKKRRSSLLKQLENGEVADVLLKTADLQDPTSTLDGGIQSISTHLGVVSADSSTDQIDCKPPAVNNMTTNVDEADSWHQREMALLATREGLIANCGAARRVSNTSMNVDRCSLHENVPAVSEVVDGCTYVKSSNQFSLSDTTSGFNSALLNETRGIVKPSSSSYATSADSKETVSTGLPEGMEAIKSRFSSRFTGNLSNNAPKSVHGTISNERVDGFDSYIHSGISQESKKEEKYTQRAVASLLSMASCQDKKSTFKTEAQFGPASVVTPANHLQSNIHSAYANVHIPDDLLRIIAQKEAQLREAKIRTLMNDILINNSTTSILSNQPIEFGQQMNPPVPVGENAIDMAYATSFENHGGGMLSSSRYVSSARLPNTTGINLANRRSIFEDVATVSYGTTHSVHTTIPNSQQNFNSQVSSKLGDYRMVSLIGNHNIATASASSVQAPANVLLHKGTVSNSIFL